MVVSSFPDLDVQQMNTELLSRLGIEKINLRYIESCESTNSVCLQMADPVTVVIAEQQTAGRGRRGKSWHSPLSQNIYCSIGVNKKIQAEYIGLISLQVGVSIAEVLHEQGFSGVCLKWPNDILLSGKKLGGILIETRVNAVNNFFLVIGFGLNMRLDENSLKEIDQPAIALSNFLHEAPDRQRLIIRLVSEILASVWEFGIPEVATLLDKFSQYDQIRGRQVQVITDNETISGIYRGIESSGRLQLETEQGLRVFASAEISLRES